MNKKVIGLPVKKLPSVAQSVKMMNVTLTTMLLCWLEEKPDRKKLMLTTLRSRLPLVADPDLKKAYQDSIRVLESLPIGSD